MDRATADGTLKNNTTDSTFGAGGVAFGGDQPKSDNLKIGEDVNAERSGSTTWPTLKPKF